MSSSSHTRHAEGRTVSIATDRRRRRMPGGAVALLAAALLLALPVAGWAQQKVLVISLQEFPLTVMEHINDATAGSPNAVCTATYNVRLSTEPSDDVTVTVVSADTKIARVSPKTLTFTAANWFGDTTNPNGQTVTVTCVNDDVANASGERQVTITNEPNGGGFRTVKPVIVTVYDEEEEVAGILVHNNADPVADVSTVEGRVAAEVDEGGTGQTDSYTVRLNSEPTDNVIVDVASGDTNGATVSPPSLTFTPTNWNKDQTVTVAGVNDRVTNAGDSRTVTITHTPRGGGYGRGEIFKVTVTVHDRATPLPRPTRGMVYSPEQPIFVEGSEAATYTVKLSTRPTGTVTLDLTRSKPENEPAYITIKPTNLAFTTANWDTPQPVTVTAVDDDESNDNDNDVDFTALSRKTTITHQPRGGGYDGLTTGLTLTIAVRDDDTHGLLLNRKSVRLVDAGNTAIYTVVLRSEPTGEVTVTPEEDPRYSSDHSKSYVADVQRYELEQAPEINHHCRKRSRGQLRLQSVHNDQEWGCRRRLFHHRGRPPGSRGGGEGRRHGRVGA